MPTPQTPQRAKEFSLLQRLVSQHTELIFLPLLGSAAIVLSFQISKQIVQFPADIIAVPLFFTMIISSLINGVLLLLFRDVEISSVITFLLLGFFYSLLILEPVMGGMKFDFVTLLQSWWFFLLFSAIVLFILKKHWARVGATLNTVVLTVVLLQVFVLMAHEFRGRVTTLKYWKQCEKFEYCNWDKNKPQRDVYYVIIDGCGSDEVLKTVYKDDQSTYTAELRKLGFIVPARNHSNYSMTMLSLAGTLNMQYINNLSEILGRSGFDFAVNNSIIRDNALMRMFREHGYKIFNVSSGFGPTWWNPLTENLHAGWFNECVFSILQRSVAVVTSREALMENLRGLRLAGFSQLAASAQISGPKLVFTHIILPHPPYLFDSEGHPVREGVQMNFQKGGTKTERTYSDQADFAKRKLMEAVKVILANSKIQPIIIIQSDHGPATLGDLYSSNPQPDYIVERMGIFNAMLLPGVDSKDVPEDFTSVNTFRVMLNTCMGTHYPLLPNKSYMSSYALPLDFKDVSEYVSNK